MGAADNPHFKIISPATGADKLLKQEIYSELKAIGTKGNYLFSGADEKGKMAATGLLAERTGLPAYRVGLSQLISKYIGETEKNLERLFQSAEEQKCVLFFDEADALFGKRTEVRDAHDRYANQEVSYLLEKMAAYNGISILSAQLKTNIDTAFTRRFKSVIHFP